MEEEIINGPLLIKGNLLCGDDGILEADGDISWGFALMDETHQKQQAEEMFKDLPAGDYDIAGKKVRVHGHVFIWDEIVCDLRTFKGRIVAACATK